MKPLNIIENEDFESFAKTLAKGRPMTEYIIKLDIAKEMAIRGAVFLKN